MLSLWQSGAYRLMDDDVPYPSALPTAEGAPTPYKDDEGEVRRPRAGPQSLARFAWAPPVPSGLRSTNATKKPNQSRAKAIPEANANRRRSACTLAP